MKDYKERKNNQRKISKCDINKKMRSKFDHKMWECSSVVKKIKELVIGLGFAAAGMILFN
jgi:hypothetical protein